MQYTEYFGDGDSKAYLEVQDCYKNIVGYVQKHVGTALRKLKKEHRGIGSKGKLTNSMINELQKYDGNSIQSNSEDLSGMRSAIHASPFHCISS